MNIQAVVEVHLLPLNIETLQSSESVWESVKDELTRTVGRGDFRFEESFMTQTPDLFGQWRMRVQITATSPDAVPIKRHDSEAAFWRWAGRALLFVFGVAAGLSLANLSFPRFP